MANDGLPSSVLQGSTECQGCLGGSTAMQDFEGQWIKILVGGPVLLPKTARGVTMSMDHVILA
jgi:hypothetical protein